MTAIKTNRISILDIVALLGPQAAMYADELAALDIDDSDLMVLFDDDIEDVISQVSVINDHHAEADVSINAATSIYGIDTSAAFPGISGDPVFDAFTYQNHDHLALVA